MTTNSNPSAPHPAVRRKGRTIACNVRMLDDTVEVLHVPVKSLGQALFNEVVQKLSLLESDYFDLQYFDIHGMPCWLDKEKPILRQLPRHKIDVQFVVKFYTPDPGLLEDELTRYLMALQVRRDLATGCLPCQEHTAILLASYIVQAEYGDYVEEDFGIGPGYLKSLKLLPNQNEEIEAKIMGHHREHFGHSPADADIGLLDIARKMEHYGLRMYSAKDHEGVPLHLSVAHMGVLVFQSLVKINTFSWAKIRKLSFKRKKFLIKLHPEGYGFYKDTVEFYFDSRDRCKTFWKYCIEHHAFFRCHIIKRLPRHQSNLVSRGSSFRYCGRTQKQLVEYARENFVKRPAFPRSSSSRTVSLGRSIGASPRTGTLTSQDLHLSQMTNVSCGSHVISSSPLPTPHNERQQTVASLTRTHNSNQASFSPSVQLSPQSPPFVESMYYRHQPSSVNGRLTNGEMVPGGGGFDPVHFQLAIDQNVSGSTSTASELHSPPVLPKVEAVSNEYNLTRSFEVENIPAQLNDINSSVSARNGYHSVLTHSQSVVSPDPSTQGEDLSVSGAVHKDFSAPELPSAYEICLPPGQPSVNSSTFNFDSLTNNVVHNPSHSTPIGGYNDKVQYVAATGKEPATLMGGSVSFTSDGSIASSVIATADDDGRLKKSMSKAFYIVKELLMTERTYKKDMEIINKWFRDAVSRDDILTDSLNELLFGLINSLYEFHCNFLKQIEQRLAFWETRSNSQSTSDARQISDVLFSLTSVLPRYRNYLDHEEELLIALDAECKENRVFDRLYREFEMQKVCYLPINSFLLKPPQRLLHYQLILNKLLQQYSNSHPNDYSDCQELLIRIGELTHSYQGRMRRAEMLQKLIELQQDLVGVEDLLQPSRVFIREGCLQKLSSKGYQQRMFFLFSDMLVYASRMPTRSLQFKVHGCLSLSNMGVKESDTKANAANSFTIFAGNRLLVVAASSETEKNKWMEDLELALEHSTSNKVDTGKVLYPSLKSNSSSEVADDSDTEVLVDRQIQHRTNTLMHVCWHRNTSVSMVERSIAVRHLLSGYLLRKFKSGSGWQKLWVVFTNFCLFFYKSHQDDFPLASLPLLGYSVQLPSPEDGIQKDFVFKLQFKNHIYLFRAESQYTFERWMEVITLATSKSRHMRLFSRMESDNASDNIV